jgi:hypothetical protein
MKEREEIQRIRQREMEEELRKQREEDERRKQKLAEAKLKKLEELRQSGLNDKYATELARIKV